MLGKVLELFVNEYSLLILSVILLLIYWFKDSNHDYWRKQGVKGPTPVPYYGDSLTLFFWTFPEIEKRRYTEYGKIYGTFEKSIPVLTVGDPDLIKQIIIKNGTIFVNHRRNVTKEVLITKLLTSLRDEDWKRVRSIMSPTFTSGKIKRMLKTIEQCSENILRILDSKAAKKEILNMKTLFGAFTMDVIARCAFATETNTYEDANHPFVSNVKEILTLKFWRLFLVILCPQMLREYFNIKPIPDRVFDFFKSTVNSIIKMRKEKNLIANDFLQLLLDAEQNSANLAKDIQDINEGHFVSETNDEIENSAKLLSDAKKGNKKLTVDEIIAQSTLFLIAGYETTASLLSFCSYCLALNPECQKLLYDEIRSNLEENGEIDYETLNSIPYLNAVISETLRLYPPILKIEREASEDYRLPNSDIIIPKRGRVAIPIYAMHHDPDYFPEPEAFKPERFLPENAKSIKPYTYLPFSTGPRNCIGMRFALVEAKAALYKVVSNFEFIVSDQTDIPLKFRKSINPLFPAKKIELNVKKRIHDSML